jgi:hypothetical protein
MKQYDELSNGSPCGAAHVDIIGRAQASEVRAAWRLSSTAFVNVKGGKVTLRERQRAGQEAQAQSPPALPCNQVKKSPDIDTEKPVSRQHETQYCAYYGYPYYWKGGGLWGGGNFANLMMPGYAGYVASPPSVQSQVEDVHARTDAARQQDGDLHLRSCTAVMSYHIHATDGAIGHVHGLLVDDETWAIRYVIVATSHWWAGHQVLIAPKLIREVDWAGATVSVKLTQQAVKDAPLCDWEAQLTRERELGVYDQYDHLGYWATQVKRVRNVINR